MKEIWKAVPCLHGYYEVSNFGTGLRRVKGWVSRNRWGTPVYIDTSVGKMMKPSIDDDGYLRVRPSVNGKYKWYGVHQLVANAFLGPCPDGMVVNHKDLDKQNNRWTNLEYTSGSGNQRHARRNGVMMGPPRKLSWNDALKVRKLYASGEWSLRKLAKSFGVTFHAIHLIVKNRSYLVAPRKVG